MHMRTYYAYYEPQQRVPDQGLPLPQQGVPYQVQQVPQLLTVQQQPFSYNLEWHCNNIGSNNNQGPHPRYGYQHLGTNHGLRREQRQGRQLGLT